jgi:Glycosyltransferase Family 4
MTKKILIISYDWIPRNSIAVHRPYSWAKYWSTQGCQITVLTAEKCAYDEPLDLRLDILPHVRVVEVPYRANVKSKSKFIEKIKSNAIWVLKKNANLIKKLFNIEYDIRDLWAEKALIQAIDLCNKNRYDVVVSTYGPRACHFIAAKIKSLHPSVKWIADYRDLWSIRHNSGLPRKLLDKEHSLELLTVSGADAITTVSPPLARALVTFLGKKTHVIYNGFDVDLNELVLNLEANKNNSAKRNRIQIVYTGMIYPGWQDPTPLFAAINQLIYDGEINSGDINVDFFGWRQPGLAELIKVNRVESFVFIHGHVNREVAIEFQKKSDILLILESGRPEANGVLTGKLFEYMVSGRPVLSLGSSAYSSIADVIGKTGIGMVCGNDVEKIKKTLVAVLKGKTSDFFNPNVEEINKFNRREQSILMLNIINKI